MATRHPIDKDAFVVEREHDRGFIFQTWRRIDGRFCHVGHTLFCREEEERERTLADAKSMRDMARSRPPEV